MNGRLRGASPHQRELLRHQWSLCSALPSSNGDVVPDEECRWTPIEVLAPVAAALRALQQWSIDDLPRRFDAEDWWYRLQFDAIPCADGEQLVLGMDGLATVARVWLNGVEILTSSNMFVSYECEVSHLLKKSGNILLMHFSALDTQLAVRRPRPRWRAPMVEHQQLRWFRTTVLGRTPGWSPSAAVVGPWKDIWLERRRLFSVTSVSLDAQVQGTVGILQCQMELTLLGKQSIEAAELHLERNGCVLVQSLQCNASGVAGGLQVPEVALWWPHTHGEPALYSATVMIRVAGVAQATTIDLGRVGFRTITLIRADGEFSVEVNGIPVFCRGACWTPLDVVTLRSTATDCFAAIAQVRAAGMNMLRVAGTMVYEDEHFFDACDESGILVWQDLMFANMDYPSDDVAFVQSVTTEVRQQLRRIQGRACLAVLCGNSEVSQQAAMWGTTRELWTPLLFAETLAQLCSQYAPATAYWPSSAHGGSFPHQGDVGTTSYYGIGAYLRGFDDARRSNLKFATECLAFANVPSDEAIERMPGGLATRVHHPGWKARSPRDLGAGWDFDDVRDHYLHTLFGIDPTKLRYADHDRYLTLGRMTTGEAMARAFSEWRRPASPCNGALVLFLQDLWAGAGWGLLDETGVPKACFQALKRVLQPTTVLLSDEGGNGLYAHVINESGEEKQVELEVGAWRGGEVLVASGKKTFHMLAHSAQTLSCQDVFEHFMDLTYAYRFGPIPYNAIVATLRYQDGTSIAQAFHFPENLENKQEGDIGLSAQVTMVDALTAELTVRTKRLAQGVHFYIPGYQPEDEFFHLAPNSDVRVTMRALQPRPLAGVICATNSTTKARLSLTPC